MSFLNRLHLAAVTLLWSLVSLRIADEKLLNGQFFYPDGHANAWTWALWLSLAGAFVPWTLNAAAWAFLQWMEVVKFVLRHTVGVPSEMNLQPARVKTAQIINFPTNR